MVDRKKSKSVSVSIFPSHSCDSLGPLLGKSLCPLLSKSIGTSLVPLLANVVGINVRSMVGDGETTPTTGSGLGRLGIPLFVGGEVGGRETTSTMGLFDGINDGSVEGFSESVAVGEPLRSSLLG